MASYRSLLGSWIGSRKGRSAQRRPSRRAGLLGSRLGIELLESRQLLTVAMPTIGSVVGQGTILSQTDSINVNIQSAVVGGQIAASGQLTLTFPDAKVAGVIDTFTAGAITSLNIYQPTGTGTPANSNSASISGYGTLNGGTTRLPFSASLSLPFPATAGSVGGLGFTICDVAPAGTTTNVPPIYTTPWKPWDATPAETIAITGAPATPTSTTTTLTSSANPSVFGQPVTFTATVGMNPASTNPVSGTVSFTVDQGTPVNVAVSSAGKATYTAYGLSLGTHAIVASYGGATLLAPSQGTLTQTVGQANSATYLTYSGSFVYGQPLSLTASVGVAQPGSGRPTGSVTFYDGAAALQTFTLPAATNTSTANSVTLVLPTGLAVGSHTLTAVYNGDTNFVAGTSNVVKATVAAVASATKLTAGANPVTTGQTVTFTAAVAQNLSSTTVTKLTAIPTGTVTFSDGTTKLDTVALDATGTAQKSASFTLAGSHSIVASYSGDAIFGPSSISLSEMVQAITTTQLASSVNPSVFGQPVTFTATVAPTPNSTTAAVAGTVTFTIDQGAPINAPVSGGKAVYTTSGLAVGTHSVVTSFGGSSLFTASQATLSQVVTPSASITYLSCGGSFVFGQPVTLTAMVGAKSPGSGIPTGSVTFYDGTTALGPAAPIVPATVAGSTNGGNLATLSLPTGLGVGSHVLSAVYGGDANFLTSTSASVTKTVAAVASATRLSASANPVAIGQSVTFTANVAQLLTSTTGTPLTTIPTGSVTFCDGTTRLGTIQLDATGAAQVAASFTTAGSHSIVASYSGDAIYDSSTGTLSESVQSVTSLQLTSSANPSVFGQPVTFTAVVPVTTSPTGGTTNTAAVTVTFTIDQGAAVPVQVVGGKAAYTTSTLALGTHAVVASYGGTSSTTPSQATLSQVVRQANSVTYLSASGSFVAGQPLTLTAMVGPQSPASGIPTGNVPFFDGTTSLGTAQIIPATVAGTTPNAANSATLTLQAGLRVGSHVLSAVYAGDTNFLTSTSAPITKIVAGVASTTRLAASANPVNTGQTVTFTATVSQYVTSTTGTPLTTIPTGTVTFSDGNTKLGTIQLDATGAAQVSASFTTAGSHAILASYSGDTVYGPSAATLAESVRAVTTTQLTSSVNPSVFGQSVTFTASVSTGIVTSPTGGTTTQPVAGGTMTFTIDQGTPVNVPVINGKATYATSGLAVGTHSVLAAYGGTSVATASQATLSQVVNQANSATSLTVSGSSIPGAPISLTAVVGAKSPGGGRPTGSVTFYDGTSPLGSPIAITGTSTAVTLSLPTGLGIGSHALSAVYAGDTNFLGSSSNTVTKVLAAVATTTRLTSSATSATVGVPVTLTAVVLASTTNSGAATKAPGGSVQFFDGQTLLATVPLNSTGTATWAQAFATSGSHALSAVYSGDTTFATSTGTLAQSVVAAVTTPNNGLSLAARDKIFGALS